MKNTVVNKLNQIEEDYHVKVLYCCEAGSRTWGLASKESDFDVRFIYIHTQDYYLGIDPVGIGKKSDVIELPISTSLDMSGWELTKTLRLFRKSNPSLLEWIHSSIVYAQAFSTVDKMERLIPVIVNPGVCILHYLNIANTNVKKCQQNKRVTVKQLINVIRPILAAMWIKTHQEFPPIEFKVLLEKLIKHGEIKQQILLLLDAKTTGNSFEPDLDRKLLLEFAEQKMELLKVYTKNLQTRSPDYTKQLDRLFQETLKEAWE
ncbi:DNA polymerase beta superfamily protein [Virgibacillus sp. DJP39]|uniref:nucleotidyltransferase domain-containing protein n=1 Tax=Virgibacillus sp. DJP39 TaxID=3409790 RepID=UPI003BB69FC1